MDANKHPTKGLCTSQIEPIHKINDIERRLANVHTVQEEKIADDIIFCLLKRHLLSFEDSFVSLKPNCPKNHI